MAARTPKPEPEPTPEERRAQKVAAWEARRAAKGRPVDGPARWEIVGADEPPGPTYVIASPRAKGPEGPIVVRHVRN